MQSQLCGNQGQFIEAPIPNIGEASAFPDMSASVTCRLSFAEITGSLSKHRFQISKRHLVFQTCQHLSHAESALRKSQAVSADVSAPVTCRLSLAEITSNLSKISCEVEST
ncbi:hypothetical protein ACFX15_024530 [Malus domestica]